MGDHIAGYVAVAFAAFAIGEWLGQKHGHYWGELLGYKKRRLEELQAQIDELHRLPTPPTKVEGDE